MALFILLLHFSPLTTNSIPSPLYTAFSLRSRFFSQHLLLLVFHPQNVTIPLASWLGKEATPGWKHVLLLSLSQVVRAV
jgi:hypothetical protein